MRLPIPNRDVLRDLNEFDLWITPSLGEINDTEKFKTELARVAGLFDKLGAATENFRDERHCRSLVIAETLAQIAKGLSVKERAELFKSVASTLFLVTGKSDNNAKCQFALFLRDVARWNTLPAITRKGIVQAPLPRTIKSDDYMKLVAAIENDADERRLLEQFISFLLKDDDAVRQLWTLGYSYYGLKQFGRGYEQNLLSPIVIFKVRGSVSASGGHKPEARLREFLAQWGLIAGEDFNLNDVIVDGNGAEEEPEGEAEGKTKTRAYDFVLPFKTPGWNPKWNNRILMQSQFYAGDSGSVSHKNVDQTTTSRTRVLKKFADVRFVEYVDGAGYFSSLNGDLRKLLNMATTHSFTQIRSAAIRLRRELQGLGFLTPLEIEHAIVRTSGRNDEVRALLIREGYAGGEVKRGVNRAKEAGLIVEEGQSLTVREDRRETVRQHLLLDVLAINGKEIAPGSAASAASIVVPGYGAFYGLELDEFARVAVENAGTLREEVGHSQTFAADIKALSQRGFTMMR